MGHRGQVQGAGGQVQGAGGQFQGPMGKVQAAGGQDQGAGFRLSWAGVTRGQSQGYDARKNIDCRDGNQCRYNQQGGCRYGHKSTNNLNSHSLQSNEPLTSKSTFDMQEMKLILDNLAKVVYNLKSLGDFPRVQQKEIEMNQ